ncbi:hypothetical protein [Paenibacillus larvae]|nr:hypothetical protein [Paenibacillus larvae]
MDLGVGVAFDPEPVELFSLDLEEASVFLFELCDLDEFESDEALFPDER